MSSELNMESVNTILPPLPPQREVLTIINPNTLITDDILEGLEPPALQRYETEKQQLEGEQLEEPEDIFIRGEFLYIRDENSREMLVNAWNAITEVDMWNYMRNDCYSYMLSDDKQISIISDKMEELGYNGHSGCSFGWTMRQMQYIAKHGEEKYAEEIILSNKEKESSNHGYILE